jgi:ABC-type sugar transport system substrate-binding protein
MFGSITGGMKGGSPVNSRLWASTIGCLMVGLALGACGSTSSSGSSASKLKVGVIDFDITSVPAQREANAVSDALKAQGWEVIQEDSAGDVNSANSICQAYVTEGFNVIVSDVWSASEMSQCFTATKAANIPVFFLASALGPNVAGAISTSLTTSINQLFITAVKAASKPVILTLQFSPGLPCLQRQQVMDTMRTAAGIPASSVTRHEENANAWGTDAKAATTAWLDAHPASLGQQLFIWSCTSLAGEGAVAALKELGRTATQYTWDLTSQDVPLIENGTFSATSISNATILGQQMVGMIKRYEANPKASPEGLLATALVLTPSNMADYAAHNKIAAG